MTIVTGKIFLSFFYSPILGRLVITVCKGLEECVLLILTRVPPCACPCLSAQPPIISHWQAKPRPPPPIFRFPQPPTKSDFLPRWNSDLSGGRNLDFSGRNFGFAATSWGRLIRQQSVRRKPRGAGGGGEGEISSTHHEQRGFLVSAWLGLMYFCENTKQKKTFDCFFLLERLSGALHWLTDGLWRNLQKTNLVFKFGLSVEGYLVEKESRRPEIRGEPKPIGSEDLVSPPVHTLNFAAHNTISTFDLLQDLHNGKGVCLLPWGVPRRRTQEQALQQPGKYMYMRADTG